MAERPSAPAASVVIPAYRAGATLAACLESLYAQEFDGEFEIVVVVTGDGEEEIAYAKTIAEDPRLRVIVRRARLGPAQGRNFGVAHARGSILVFTDADVVTEPGWLQAIVDATAGGMCVGGAVVNGTPASRAGTAEYLVEFLDLHPERPPATAWHAASANMAMDRQTWADFGPLEANGGPRLFLESSDTILSMKAAADGRLRFCPDARIRHMNRTTLGVVLSHQIGLGRSAAILARRSATLPHRDLVARAWAAPMVAGARWLSLWRRLLSWRIGLSPRAFSLSPELLLALGSWGYGLFRANREFAAAER